MSDVNDLLARLKTPQHGSAPETNRSTSFSGLQHPQPASSDRSTNLLNLLKFNQPSSTQPHARAASASGTAQQSSSQAGSGNPQDALLKLLNRQEATASSAAKSPGSQPFSYVSPFDDLAATAPTKSKQPSKTPTPLPDGRTQVEALLGIGAKKHDSETVGEALAEAGDQARDEASDAVARAEASAAMASEQDPHAVEDAMREVRDIPMDTRAHGTIFERAGLTRHNPGR